MLLFALLPSSILYSNCLSFYIGKMESTCVLVRFRASFLAPYLIRLRKIESTCVLVRFRASFLAPYLIRLRKIESTCVSVESGAIFIALVSHLQRFDSEHLSSHHVISTLLQSILFVLLVCLKRYMFLFSLVG